MQEFKGRLVRGKIGLLRARLRDIDVGPHPDDAGDLAELWREIDRAVSGVIDHVTVEDLRRRAEERRRTARPMYHI